MRLDIYPSFISQEEINALNEWVNLGVINKWLDYGASLGDPKYKKRLTSRMYRDRYEYPEIVRTISNRIRKFVGVDGYPLIEQGRDGVVVSYTLPGGDVYRHVDPPGLNGTATLRCNILTQKSDTGGKLFVDGDLIDIAVGDLHCYLASEHEHWATTAEGNTPRIMWMFGAHVPAEDWNSGKIKVQQ